MKKSIISSVAILATVFNHSFAETPRDSLTTTSRAIKTLIVNADVTVVLVDNVKANLEVTGRSSLRDIVTFKEIGDTLVIETMKKKNVRGAGVIYVPAGQLKNLRINSEAHVTTFYPLLVPTLDVVINGACTVNLASMGKINMTATPFYSVEQTTEVHRIDSGILERLRNYF